MKKRSCFTVSSAAGFVSTNQDPTPFDNSMYATKLLDLSTPYSFLFSTPSSFQISVVGLESELNFVEM